MKGGEEIIDLTYQKKSTGESPLQLRNFFVSFKQKVTDIHLNTSLHFW